MIPFAPLRWYEYPRYLWLLLTWTELPTCRCASCELVRR